MEAPPEDFLRPCVRHPRWPVGADVQIKSYAYLSCCHLANDSSLPGLTRQSILFERLFRRWMDTRVKPAYDAEGAVAFPGMQRGALGGVVRCGAA
jgi:hypothetical protein